MASGQQTLQLARKHIGEKYVLGAQAPKDAANYKGPWDCAEFASWLIYQVSQRLYGCLDDGAKPEVADAFTGAWARDAGSLGLEIPVEEAARTAGALVIRRPGEAGMTIGHIVVSDGAGGTVEAHSTKRGVIADTLAKRRWSFGIRVPWVEYEQGAIGAPMTPPPATLLRLTSPTTTGAAVRNVQRQLKAAGFDPGPIDGEFGPRTMLTVAAFQRAKGLAPDGEVGPLTAKALARAAR